MSGHWAEDDIVALLAIYEDEIKVTYHEGGDVATVERTILPLTAADTGSQFLKVDVRFTFPPKLSHEHLQVNFVSSRGLNDDRLNQLREMIKQRIEEDSSDGLLYDIMEIIGENLTQNNLPSDPCPICLIKFKTRDNLVVTKCFHHFHNYCLKQYIDNYELEWEIDETLPQLQQEMIRKEQQLESQLYFPCPKCRQKLKLSEFKFDGVDMVEPHDDDLLSEVDLAEISGKMRRMQLVYDKQMAKGGIITKQPEQSVTLHITRPEPPAVAIIQTALPQNHDTTTHARHQNRHRRHRGRRK